MKTINLCLAVCLSLCPIICRSQSQPAVMPKTLPLQRPLHYYPCVNYTANRLIYPGDSTKLLNFYAKLDSLSMFGSGNINIVHIGGSHIQADVYSNRMRLNFANSLPGFSAQRGAIFPFAAAKTNNPKNYMINYSGKWRKSQNSRPPITETLGIMGYTISTDDRSSYISFLLNTEEYKTNWKYNRLRLLAQVNDSSLMPVLIVNEDTIPAKEEDESFVFYLNSFAQDGIITLYPNSERERLEQKYNSMPHNSVSMISTDSLPELQLSVSDSLNIGLECDNNTETIVSNYRNQDNSLFSIMGILPENDFNGITYHALGVNGASLKSWLRCEKFEHQMHFLKPDLAIMAVGVNDANVPYGTFSTERYKEEYRKLLGKIYTVNPECAVIFITNNDCVLRTGRYSYGPNKNTALVQNAIMELAEEEGAAVWDLYDIMGGLGSMAVWRDTGLANKDRVHFLVSGYELLGDMMYNAIIFDWLYK